MIEYYIVFLLTLLVQLYPVKSNSDYKKRLFFTFLPLFLFGALRVDFGRDYIAYENYFNAITTFSTLFSVDDHMEKGFALLNFVIPNFRSLLVLTSLLMCFSYATLFYKLVKPNYTWLAVLLLFLAGDKTIFFTLVAMRNGIVVSILILSFSYIQHRKLFPFIIITIFSYYIHTSAILFFPLAYILGSNKTFTRKQIYQWFTLSIIMVMLSFSNSFDKISLFVDLYLDRYSSYVEIMDESGRGISLLIILSAIFLILSIFYYVVKTPFYAKENTLIRLSLLFIFSYLLGSLNARMSQYFALFFIVAATSMIANWKNKLFKDAYMIFVISFLGYGFFVVWMGSEWFAFKDYHSLLGKYLLDITN